MFVQSSAPRHGRTPTPSSIKRTNQTKTQRKAPHIAMSYHRRNISFADQRNVSFVDRDHREPDHDRRAMTISRWSHGPREFLALSRSKLSDISSFVNGVSPSSSSSSSSSSHGKMRESEVLRRFLLIRNAIDQVTHDMEEDARRRKIQAVNASVSESAAALKSSSSSHPSRPLAMTSSSSSSSSSLHSLARVEEEMEEDEQEWFERKWQELNGAADDDLPPHLQTDQYKTTFSKDVEVDHLETVSHVSDLDASDNAEVVRHSDYVYTGSRSARLVNNHYDYLSSGSEVLVVAVDENEDEDEDDVDEHESEPESDSSSSSILAEDSSGAMTDHSVTSTESEGYDDEIADFAKEIAQELFIDVVNPTNPVQPEMLDTNDVINEHRDSASWMSAVSAVSADAEVDELNAKLELEFVCPPSPVLLPTIIYDQFYEPPSPLSSVRSAHSASQRQSVETETQTASLQYRPEQCAAPHFQLMHPELQAMHGPFASSGYVDEEEDLQDFNSDFDDNDEGDFEDDADVDDAVSEADSDGPITPPQGLLVDDFDETPGSAYGTVSGSVSSVSATRFISGRNHDPHTSIAISSDSDDFDYDPDSAFEEPDERQVVHFQFHTSHLRPAEKKGQRLMW